MRISREELEKYFAYYPRDNEYTSYCRYLQSRWRKSKQYPKAKNGQLGNYLDLEFAIKTKSNFLTSKIRTLVENEVKNSRKTNKLISEPRIWNNLLSSQPLAFNLFGEFYYDLNSATQSFKSLFPEIIEKIIKIDFEYSPGRNNNKYTGDRSAFDVFIEYEAKKSKMIGFLGIEVKYIESLSEESKRVAENIFKKHETRYTEITNQSGIFKENSVNYLKVPPLSQIWRDHLLAISLREDYDEGYFVFLCPEANIKCQTALNAYCTFLVDSNYHNNLFLRLGLESCVDTFKKLINANWIGEFKNRYIGLE